MTRWTIIRRAQTPGTNIEWHVAEGPDPGTNPDGMRSSVHQLRGGRIETSRSCAVRFTAPRAIDPYPCAHVSRRR
jgi:hypothetical protein